MENWRRWWENFRNYFNFPAVVLVNRQFASFHFIADALILILFKKHSIKMRFNFNVWKLIKKNREHDRVAAFLKENMKYKIWYRRINLGSNPMRLKKYGLLVPLWYFLHFLCKINVFFFGIRILFFFGNFLKIDEWL